MLVLGSVVFKEFEIPEKIVYGGKHTLALHTFVGGRRTIDALGPDDAPITWEGRLQGEDATARAAQLEALRNAGAEIELIWADQFRLVVVSDLELTHERPYQILYRITCTVSSNPARDSAATSLFSALSGLVGADLSSLAAVVGPIASQAVTGGLMAAVAPIAAADLDSLTAGRLISLTPPLADAIDALDAVTLSSGTTLDAAFDTTTPVQLAQALMAKQAQLDEHSAYALASVYASRINANLVLGAANG